MPTIAPRGRAASAESNTSASRKLAPIPTIFADITFRDGFHIETPFQEITHSDYEYPKEGFFYGMAKPISKIGFPVPHKLPLPPLPKGIHVTLDHPSDTIKISWDKLVAPKPLPPVQIAIRLIHDQFIIVGAALKPEAPRAIEDTFPLYDVGRAAASEGNELFSWILFSNVNLPDEGDQPFDFEYTILIQERPKPELVNDVLNTTIGYIDPEIECDPT